MITHNPHNGAIDHPDMDTALWTPEFSVHPMGSISVQEDAEIFLDGTRVEVVSQGRVVTTINDPGTLVLRALDGVATPGPAPADLPRGRPIPY